MSIVYSAIYVCIIIIVIVTIYSFLAYYYTTYQNDMTDSHVLFIREPINGTTKNQMWKADKILPATSSYTFATWLLINQFDNTPGYKMIFMKGSGVSNLQPAVFLGKQNDEIVISISTVNDTAPTLPGDPTFETKKKTDQNIITVSNIPTGLWFSIGISVDNSIANVFINGMLVKSQVLSGHVHITAHDHLYVGPAASEDLTRIHSAGFNGKIAQLRYYPYVLSTNQFQEIYNLGLTPSYNPISKAIDMVDKVDTDLTHGIDLIVNKLKPMAQDVESVGKRLVDAVQNTAAYKELAKLTRDAEAEAGKGLSGAGSLLDNFGKELIYGKDWENQTQYMLNDPQLMKESCNTPSYTPFLPGVSADGNISNNYNNKCVSDCDCFYTSTCEKGVCSPLKMYNTQGEPITVNYERMTGKGKVKVVDNDQKALNKYPYNTDLSNTYSYIKNNTNLDAHKLVGNQNYQLCKNACNTSTDCEGYLFNTGNPSIRECAGPIITPNSHKKCAGMLSESQCHTDKNCLWDDSKPKNKCYLAAPDHNLRYDPSKCGPQNMCYLIDKKLNPAFLPTDSSKLFDNSVGYSGIFQKITKDKDGHIIPNQPYDVNKMLPSTTLQQELTKNKQ